MSAREAAAALGVSERTIRRAIQRGELPAVRRGASYQIAQTDLRHYAEKDDFPQGKDRPGPPTLVALPLPELRMAPLPVPLSPFVGRRAEIAAVGALLGNPGVRLLTLTGPGGAGKTRLAIETATGLRASFPDGAVFVDLAAVTQPDLVVPAIAREVGLRGMPDREPRERLQAFLQPKRLLMVLDNFEQVLGAAPLVAALLANARDLKVLVTSRAPLRVAGEREYPVPPLGLTIEDGSSPSEALLGSDAGRLFVERARAHDPRFAIDDAGAATIAEVCARLDGLPLAIELAAARMKTLTPRALLARLDRWLPLLTEGHRDAPDRLRTMRNAIAWSYDLLDAATREVFRRLSVFVGGFTLDGADAVCGPRAEGGGRKADENAFPAFRPPPSASVLDSVSMLVEQSLVVRTVDGEGLPRFRMLETMREFGMEKLTGHVEDAETRSRHARYVLDLAVGRDGIGPLARQEQIKTLLATERADLVAALTWFDAAGSDEEFFQLLMAFENTWLGAGLSEEGRKWLERALAKAGGEATEDRAKVLVALGKLAAFRGETREAVRMIGEGATILRHGRDSLQLAIALIWLGTMANQAGDYARAEAPLDEALGLTQGVGDRLSAARVEAAALANLGVSARGRGDLDLAEERLNAAHRLYREQGLEEGVTRTFLDLGDIARDRGDLVLAVERYRTCLARLGERVELRVAAEALEGIASAGATWGLAETAARLFGAAEAMRERAGATILFPVDREDYRRRVETLHGHLGEAGFATAKAEGRAMVWDHIVAIVSEVVPPVGPDAAAPPSGDRPALSRREAEVLRLLVGWKTDREISAALHVSPRTVEWHVGSILNKLGVESRREAVALAVRDQLV